MSVICPHCNSTKTESKGIRYNMYRQYICKQCGKKHSRFLDSDKIVIKKDETEQRITGIHHNKENQLTF